MTFVYELYTYSLDMYQMGEYELPTSRFSKFMSDTHTCILHTYLHTDRQTRPKLYTMPLRCWAIIKN